MGYWAFDPRQNKSYVPKAVRGDTVLRKMVYDALPSRRGRNYAVAHGPYTPRDPNDIGPCDVFEADDLTPDHLVCNQDTAGRWWTGRLEMLLLIDRRTFYPVTYLLKRGELPEIEGEKPWRASYNGVDVRRLLLDGHDKIGFPHLKYYLENGIWASKTATAPFNPGGWDEVQWAETEFGLSGNGLGIRVEVTHALPHNARAKLIEGVNRQVKARLRCQSGYVGKDEKTDGREAMKALVSRLKSRPHEDPRNLGILTLGDVRDMLDQELTAFRNDPQTGKWLPGVTPQEAWLNGIGGHPGYGERPATQLGPLARVLFATHACEVRVTDRGAILPEIGRELVFWGDELLPFKNGASLRGFVHLEDPELVTFQPKNGSPFTLRARSLPSSTATKEQLRADQSAKRRWLSQGRTVFSALPHPLRYTVSRDPQEDSAIAKLGGEYQAAREHDAAEKRAEASELARVKRLAGALGADVPRQPRNAKRVMEGLDLEKEALAELAALEPQKPPTT